MLLKPGQTHPAPHGKYLKPSIVNQTESDPPDIIELNNGRSLKADHLGLQKQLQTIHLFFQPPEHIHNSLLEQVGKTSQAHAVHHKLQPS